MLASKQDRKKQLEAHYLEEARRASAIFPAGTLEVHEKTDFLLHADRGNIGIEVHRRVLNRFEKSRLYSIFQPLTNPTC